MKTPGMILTTAVLAIAACSNPAPWVLGTLERDRIVLPSPAFERIAEIRVREGQRVQAGDVLMLLESARAEARSQALVAEAARAEGALAEARQGPRQEAIAEARARWRKAQSVALDAHQGYQRVATIVARKLLPAAELDRARAAKGAADADVAATLSALQGLQNGTRSEQIAQAESILRAATAQAAAANVDLARTEIRAPRDGLIDNIPYEVGDQPSVGAPLAILLVGAHPYARVYVPQPQRAQWQVGAAVQVHIQGETDWRIGTVRRVQSEPSFTPYYALSGEDAARLSYLAEVELDNDDAALAAGLPLSAKLSPGSEH
jgi:HlyD family secretion protein